MVAVLLAKVVVLEMEVVVDLVLMVISDAGDGG